MKVWKQQHESSDSQKVMLAQILIEFDVIISRENTTVRSKLLYNGEFDPGSGWTLAAGLIHASRGVTWVAIPDDDRQTGAEHVRNLPITGE